MQSTGGAGAGERSDVHPKAHETRRFAIAAVTHEKPGPAQLDYQHDREAMTFFERDRSEEE